MSRTIIPLVVFMGLLVLLMAGLRNADQKSIIDSPLIGKPVPEFALPELLEVDRTLTNADFSGQPFVLNVWASWCPSCRVEHPLIKRMGREIDAPLVGLNWKDEHGKAMTWLGQFGDAWDTHIFDEAGRFGIDLGVYGAPETFLVDHQGIIRHKHIGPVTEESYAGLVEQIRQLEAEAGS